MLLRLSSLLFIASVSWASCIPDGDPCSHTTTPCCNANSECTSRTVTGGTCEPVAETTTTTISESSTTTTLPSSAALLRFPTIFLAQAQSEDPFTDPRNGQPADEYTRYVEASQQFWQVLPLCLNLYTSQPNSTQVENISKFYQNYSMKAGKNYEWYHPGYVTDLTANICAPVGYGDPVADAGEIALEISMMPPPLSNDEENGELSQLSGAPLTDEQCQALEDLSTTHDMQAEEAILCAEQGISPANCTTDDESAPAILPAREKFVGLATSEAERQLFDLVWDGAVNPNISLGEFIAQTIRMEQDHKAYQDAFNCGTGLPPDVVSIQLHGDSHNLRHLCRHLDPMFSTEFPVYFRHYLSVYDYERVTCAELAESN